MTSHSTKAKKTRYWLMFPPDHDKPVRETHSSLQHAFDAVIGYKEKGVTVSVWDSLESKYVLFPANDVPP